VTIRNEVCTKNSKILYVLVRKLSKDGFKERSPEKKRRGGKTGGFGEGGMSKRGRKNPDADEGGGANSHRLSYGTKRGGG